LIRTLIYMTARYYSRLSQQFNDLVGMFRT